MHGDVHPHPGPGIPVWSCNVSRGTGAMEFFDLAKANSAPILAIQEDGLSSGERDNFYRYVKKHHYRMFDGPTRIRHKNAWGGVILLVKCTLQCRLISSFSEDDGQAVTVMVETCANCTLYQPPEESRMPVACHILETFQLLPNGTPWLCFGDFNDCPSDNLLIAFNII